MHSLEFSYSACFLFFWSVILVASIGIFALESRNNQLAKKIQAPLFWIFSVFMIFFAMLRPIGLARDDLNYLSIYENICPVLNCGLLVQGARDWGWYFLVALLKSFWMNPRTMLLVSGLALSVKLWVVFKLCRRPMLALLFFTAVFYQVQDLTAFRVSLSLTLFMISFYLLSKKIRVIGVVSLGLPGLFHIQAFLSPLVLIGRALRGYANFVVLVLIPISLLFLGMYFRAYSEILAYQNIPLVALITDRVLAAYIELSQSDVYQNLRVMPYSYLPLILLMVVFSRHVFLTSEYLFRYCAMSLIVACWLTWVCAGWQEPQARFFEYFALPTVLLVGNFRNNLLSNLGVIVVAAVFVVRYNILHPLLTG